MKNFKRTKKLILFAILIMPQILPAQSPQLWVEGEISTVTLESESFETGFGNYTSSGTINWTPTIGENTDGNFSVTSGYLTNNNFNNLSRTIIVPAGVTAKLSFDHKASLTGNWNGVNLPGMIFSDNAAIQTEVYSYTDWETVILYLGAGSHLLVWECYTYNNDTNLQYWLDNIQITYVENTAVRIEDGNQAQGKVLTSDAFGNASWQYFLRGKVRFVDSQISAEVEFDEPLPNNIYYISLTPVEFATGSGFTSVGSRTVNYVTKTAEGFTIVLMEPVGVGSEMYWDWIVIP